MANVTVHNKTTQLVTIAVLDPKGKPTERKLQPYEKTEPIPEAKIGEYTRRMAALGHVRIRPVA